MPEKLVKIKNLDDPIDFYGKSWIVKTITEEDVEDAIKRSGAEKIKLTDDKMRQIADKLSDALSDCYWDCLEVVVSECLD